MGIELCQVQTEHVHHFGRTGGLAAQHALTGWWSRRVTDEHRLVYRLAAGTVEIAKFRYHY